MFQSSAVESSVAMLWGAHVVDGIVVIDVDQYDIALGLVRSGQWRSTRINKRAIEDVTQETSV